MSNIDHCIIFFGIVAIAWASLASWHYSQWIQEVDHRNSEAMRDIEKRNRRKGK